MDKIRVAIRGHDPLRFRMSGQAVTNYEALTNKPQINDVTLIGNKTSHELKLQDEMDEITAQDIDNIIYG